MSILARIKSLVTKAEGGVRPGPYWLPVSGGWLSAEAGASWNWWQHGYNVTGLSPSAIVEACVSAYAQTVAMCPGNHWWVNKDGGRERQVTSALTRILKKPNAYQSISDFMLDAVSDLYLEGNCYALGLRNSRFEIEELHLMNPRQCSARISPETGDVFYALGGNEVIDYQLDVFPLLVPARDVLHIRLNTSPHNMLLGESPMIAAARDIAAGDAMMTQQLQFYLNQARPSYVLATDMILDKAQVDALRDRWNEQSRGLNAGGVPIVTGGLKPTPLSTNAENNQLAEIMKLSEQHIALAFRVPMQILGIGGATYGSTELLMQSWIASGLGFCLNHVEEAFGNLFKLKGQPEEYLEFDTSALLRSEMKSRIESAARGVQGGIYSPNEARADFGLPKVEHGDEPRVQAQVVPLSAATGIPAAPSAPSSPSSPSVPAAPPAKESADATAKLARSFIVRADRFDRRRAIS